MCASSEGSYRLHLSTLLIQAFAIVFMIRTKPLSAGLYIELEREHSGSVVECLTRDRGAVESSLTGVTALCHCARHFDPSLVLVQPRKTRPFITERLLMGRKESNQTNKITELEINGHLVSYKIYQKWILASIYYYGRFAHQYKGSVGDPDVLFTVLKNELTTGLENK